MTPSEILDTVNEIENHFDVDSWEIDGVNVWPFIRTNFIESLLYVSLEKENLSPHRKKYNPNSSLTSKLRLVSKILSKFIKYAIAYVSDHSKNAAISQQYGTIFLSDSNDSVLINNKWYDKFCDPIIDFFKLHNYSSLRLDTGANYPIPRYNQSIYFQAKIDWAIIKLNFFSRKNIAQNIQLSGYDQFEKYLSSIGLNPYLLPISAIKYSVKKINTLSQLYLNIFEQIKPKIGLTMCYYNDAGYAFVLACKKYGIPSADIQHGVQAPGHRAYSKWSKVPKDGYNILPNYFLNWAEKDATAINEWASKITSKPHLSIVTGNLFLNQWKNDKNPLCIEFDDKINSVFSTKKPNILFTLSPEVCDKDSLLEILNVISKTDVIYNWWFRLHPLMTKQEAKFNSILKKAGAKNFNIKKASSFPLYAILRKMDLHITYCSSVVIEAEQFGVTSIIISSYGASVFSDDIKNGKATLAISAQNIIDEINRKLSQKHISLKNKNDNTELNKILSILKKSDEKLND